MIYILDIMMFTVAPLIALTIHRYIRHGDMSVKRQWAFAVFYVVFINSVVLLTARLRGVRGFSFGSLTVSYRFKYIGLGSIVGLFLPLPVCLITEDKITIGGLKRYTLRFVRDIKKYSAYAVRAAKSDLRSEVAGSYLNWLWWLIEPFCTMIIYTLIFGVVFKASEPYFPVFIFIGITMWSFFSRSVLGSVNTIRTNRGIVTKVYIPKYILLLSKMFVNGFKMLISFGIVLVMMALWRVPVTVKIFAAVPAVAVMFLFSFGVGTILIHYGVYVSDLAYITDIILKMLMYLTGVFYSVSKRMPAPFGGILEECNPVAFLISAARNAMLYGIWPAWKVLLLWGMVSLLLAALGIFTIYSNENSYAKVI